MSNNIVVYSAKWCPDCKRAKAFLTQNNITFHEVDIDEVHTAVDYLEKVNNGKRIIPTVVIDEQPHANPSNAELRALLGIELPNNHQLYDTAIIGGGAAGLTTSIYLQRDHFNSIILEKKDIGGNAALTHQIQNYPGFIDIGGPELMNRMAEQARFYGADIRVGGEVRSFNQTGAFFSIDTTEGEIQARSIVIATGSTYRKLDIPGEADLIGHGVHFCATCDGAFYRDRAVVVIGGGNSALEEGLYLSRFCKKITIVARTAFSASKTYLDKAADNPNITLIDHAVPHSFSQHEDGSLQGLNVQLADQAETTLIPADGAFVYVGLRPNTSFLKKILTLTEAGFIKTQDPSFETSMEGVFAAGDCRQGATAQVAAATGEGVIAAYHVRNYLNQKGH